VLLPSLTRRESVVADRLRSNLPLADIAESLFVSANTLKSQVHSLYVKLGASSRDEAVALLERGGFYERTHPQQERP
jgi:LuxR family maltose regulon positive regulatory protein